MFTTKAATHQSHDLVDQQHSKMQFEYVWAAPGSLKLRENDLLCWQAA
jgi:hypothetical protein